MLAKRTELECMPTHTACACHATALLELQDPLHQCCLLLTLEVYVYAGKQLLNAVAGRNASGKHHAKVPAATSTFHAMAAG